MRSFVFALALLAGAFTAHDAAAIVPMCPTLEFTISFAGDPAALTDDARDNLDAAMNRVNLCEGVTVALTTPTALPLDHLRVIAIRDALVERGLPFEAIGEVPGTPAADGVTIFIFSRGARH
jgi:hypothetical protein